MRLWVQFLASLSGLRIRSCMSCGVGCICGLDGVLLWLWHRPAAAAPIRPLAWEPSYAVSVAIKKKKKKNYHLHVGAPLISIVRQISSWKSFSPVFPTACIWMSHRTSYLICPNFYPPTKSAIPPKALLENHSCSNPSPPPPSSHSDPIFSPLNRLHCP